MDGYFGPVAAVGMDCRNILFGPITPSVFAITGRELNMEEPLRPLGPEDSMVERVARAIHGADDPKGFRQQWEYLPQSNRDYFMSCARAAIEAMREPTEAMLNAAMDASEDGYVSGDWKAMIDAALSSSPKGGSPNLPKQR